MPCAERTLLCAAGSGFLACVNCLAAAETFLLWALSASAELDAAREEFDSRARDLSRSFLAVETAEPARSFAARESETASACAGTDRVKVIMPMIAAAARLLTRRVGSRFMRATVCARTQSCNELIAEPEVCGRFSPMNPHLAREERRQTMFADVQEAILVLSTQLLSDLSAVASEVGVVGADVVLSFSPEPRALPDGEGAALLSVHVSSRTSSRVVHPGAGLPEVWLELVRLWEAFQVLASTISLSPLCPAFLVDVEEGVVASFATDGDEWFDDTILLKAQDEGDGFEALLAEPDVEYVELDMVLDRLHKLVDSRRIPWFTGYLRN